MSSRRKGSAVPSYPTRRVYNAILALRKRGERVENYCRDRRLHVIGNAILDDSMLLARAGADHSRSDHSRPSNPSTTRSAQAPEVKLARAASTS